MKRHIFSILFILLLSFWTVKPLFQSGYFSMHDDTQVARVVAMGRALRNGQFPVRWVADLGYGYGYPIFNFYGPLPYYIGGSLHALGLRALYATKIMFALGVLLAPLTFYAATAASFGRLAAMAGSIVYVYAPYHAVQIFVRGAVGEFWALVFLPLVAYGFWSGQRRQERSPIVVGGIGLSGVILSHTIIGYALVVLLFFWLVLYLIIRGAKKQFDREFLVRHAAIMTLGLGLSAFFWFPAFVERSWTAVASQIGPSAYFMNHFVCISQLWDSVWGFGGSAEGCLDGMSFKLGKLNVLMGVFSLFLLMNPKKIRKAGFFVHGFFILIVSIFFTVSASRFLWFLLPQFAYIQYPWRFLTFAMLGFSFVAASIVGVVKNKLGRAMAAVFIVGLTIIGNAKLFVPQVQYPVDPAAFEQIDDIRWRASTVSDEYLPADISRPRVPSDVPSFVLPESDAREVDREIVRETYIKLAIMAKGSQFVKLSLADFPGWRYIVNGESVHPAIIDGLPVIGIPDGRSVVELRFVNTPARTAGNVVSLMFAFALLYIYGKKAHA